MFKFTKYLRSGVVLSAITAISLGLSAGSVNAQEEDDKKEGQRVVKVDCGKGDEPQKVLETYAFETKPLILIIEGTCEDAAVEVTRNNVEFVGSGPYEQRGYITGVLKVEGGRGVSIGDNMMLDDLVIHYGQVFLDAEEGTITIYAGVGVNFQSVLTIGSVATSGSVIIESSISLLNQSLLLIQQDELASEGSVTTGNINASLQSSANIRAATIGEIGLDSDSHIALDSNVLWNGNGPGPLGRVFCDNQSRIWGPVNPAQFDVTGCMDI